MSQVAESRTVTSVGAVNAIRKCFAKKRPAFLWGPPGIGKSEVVEGIARGMNGFMIDLRLGQMDPTDIRGVPYYNKDLGVMDWAPPIDLPTQELCDQYPIVVLFLDEMNSAAPAVQAAAYQLILNRRVGKYTLPDNVVMIAAGNRESDKGVTYRMPTPLANRFIHIEMRADFTAWVDWAVNNDVHKDVVGYLSFAKQDLYDFDAKAASRSFATPRAWTFVSQFCDEKDITDAELTDLVAGTVGEGIAVKFMNHRKFAKDLPLPSDILAGKVKECKVKEISAQYALTIGMCYELQDSFEKMKDDVDGWHKLADNFFRFMMDFFPTEMTVMGCRVAINQYNLPFQPDKLKHFDEFYDRFGKYVAASNED